MTGRVEERQGQKIVLVTVTGTKNPTGNSFFFLKTQIKQMIFVLVSADGDGQRGF